MTKTNYTQTFTELVDVTERWAKQGMEEADIAKHMINYIVAMVMYFAPSPLEGKTLLQDILDESVAEWAGYKEAERRATEDSD